MRRKRARSVEVFAQPGAPPGFKIRAGSGAVAGQITDAQGGEEPGRDFQRKAGDGKSERTQFDGVLGGADNGQAQGFKAGFLPGKVVMIGGRSACVPGFCRERRKPCAGPGKDRRCRRQRRRRRARRTHRKAARRLRSGNADPRAPCGRRRPAGDTSGGAVSAPEQVPATLPVRP